MTGLSVLSPTSTSDASRRKACTSTTTMTTTTITTITHTTEAEDGTKTETRSSSSTSNTTTLIPIPVPIPVPVILPIPIPVYPIAATSPNSGAASLSPIAAPSLYETFGFEPKNSPYIFPSVPAVLAKLSPFASSISLPTQQLSSTALNPPPPNKPARSLSPDYNAGDSDSDGDDLYSPSKRFSSFSLTPPPLYPYPHPLCPATAHFFSCLPSEILYHFSGYCDIQSLLSLASLTRPLALELSVDFWKFQFISRWGSEYEVDYETRVSASMGQLMQGLRSSSAFVWNAIEFSYSEGLIPRRENRMTALVPNTTAPGLEWVGEQEEKQRERVRQERRESGCNEPQWQAGEEVQRSRTTCCAVAAVPASGPCGGRRRTTQQSAAEWATVEARMYH